jgi:hypothetical protein
MQLQRWNSHRNHEYFYVPKPAWPLNPWHGYDGGLSDILGSFPLPISLTVSIQTLFRHFQSHFFYAILIFLTNPVYFLSVSFLTSSFHSPLILDVHCKNLRYFANRECVSHGRSTQTISVSFILQFRILTPKRQNLNDALLTPLWNITGWKKVSERPSAYSQATISSSDWRMVLIGIYLGPCAK